MRTVLGHRLLPPMVAIIAILVVGQVLSPGFASGGNIIDQLTSASILAVVAAGQTIVVLTGREGIDLSVGGILSLGALLAGNIMRGEDANVLLAVPVVALVGFLFGVINGLGVTVLRIPPLVVTLGTGGVIQGILVLLTQGQTSGAVAPVVERLLKTPLVAGVPGVLFLWAAIAVLIGLLLRYTRLGVAFHAIGANDVAARLSGVRVGRVRTLAYGVSGMFAALAGVLMLGYAGTVFIGVGEAFILPSVIAVVVGGTALAGGVGGYTGTALGAITLTLLQSVLTSVDVPAPVRQMVFGLALLGFMLAYGRERRLRQ